MSRARVCAARIADPYPYIVTQGVVSRELAVPLEHPPVATCSEEEGEERRGCALLSCKGLRQLACQPPDG